MLPTGFDADVEMQYKAQRAMRDAERYRLARMAAGPDNGQALRLRFEGATKAVLSGLANSMGRARDRFARRRAPQLRETQPAEHRAGEQCC